MNKPEQNITLKVEGMTCVNCALNIERTVKKLGVDDVAVNFSTKELHVVGLNNENAETIKQAVIKAGFEISNENNLAKNNFTNKLLLYVSIAVASYFMVQMFLPHHWFNANIDLALGSLVLGIGWFKFGKGAINSALSGSANMYVLILMGATMAYFLSIYLMLTQAHAHLYFEAAAVIIALVMLGDKIEEKAIAKTTSSLSKLANFTIQKAKKLINNEVKVVGLNEIRIGDAIQVNVGDAIATDGEILSGNGSIDEAILTGESNPLFKNIGDKILGGSTLIDGNFTYKVTKLGHESALAQISKLVQKASSEKANIQRYADKISAIFVPTIIALSVIWLLVNLFLLNNTFEVSLVRSVTILVVSCPCAMGLATPIAVMVGLGKMSENGILTKKAQAIENFANIKNLLLDKTGTITTGNFKLKDLTVYGENELKILSILKSIESKSSHPIAKSIVVQLKDTETIELTEIEEIKGLGMQAKDKVGNFYKLGNAEFTNQIANSNFDNYLTKNYVLIACFNLTDEVKENVPCVLNYFTQNEIETTVLSGDNEKKCQQLSAQLNIKTFHSLKPQDKLEKIETYLHQPTAMVGDGVNDAPALSKVNVGISFSQASNIAMQSADIILLNNDFNLLKTAHKISVLTVKTIKQNLFWAFAYNILAIPLAAFGVFSPMMAAFLMLFSDLVVVGNSYLLKLKKVD